MINATVAQYHKDIAWKRGVLALQCRINAARASHRATEPLYARLHALTHAKLADEFKT